MEDIVVVVENYQPENNRSQIMITKNNTLICDSYNANPTSMSSALESFIGIQAERKLVILGDMLELGEKSKEEHIKLLNALQSHKVEKALLVGPIFQKVFSKSGFKSFSDVNKLRDFLKSEPVKGKHYSYKGIERNWTGEDL